MGGHVRASMAVASTSVPVSGRRSALASDGIDVLLRARGLSSPDGRLLHRYATTVGELDDVHWYLQSLARARWSAADCGALVLVLAEWGHAHVASARSMIPDALDALGMPSAAGQIYPRVEVGLAYWGRPNARPEPHTCNARVLLEGGLPRRMRHAGLEALTMEIESEMPWSVIADAGGTRRFLEILEARRERFPDLLGALDDRLFWHGFFDRVAIYYRDLARQARLPARGESAAQWLQRMGPRSQPSRHIPIRCDDDAVFLEILFPELAAISQSAFRNSRSGG
jgi:hypothetical protein